MNEDIPSKGFHLISFETKFGEIPLFTSENYDPGAKASVIIGPNGSGKSQVLAAICNELTNIHRIHRRHTRSDDETKSSRRLRMLDFEDEFPALIGAGLKESSMSTDFDARIVYMLDRVVWDIRRDAKSLKILRDGEPSDVDSLDFPDKVLALAHLPLDKFQFAKKNDSEFYRYLGLRQNYAMTSTGALATNTLLSFLETLDLPAGKDILERWLPVLELDRKVFASFTVSPIKLLHADNEHHFMQLGLDHMQRRFGSVRAHSVYDDETAQEDLGRFWSTFKDLREILLDGRRTGKRNRHFLFELGQVEPRVTTTFGELADFFRLGRKLRVLGGLSLSFSKGDQLVSFDDLSSGEQHILSTVTQLIANLGDRTVVLIDEPEVSLHPDWQSQYIPSLLESLSSKPDTHAIIATHSHFLVSDIRETSGSLTVASRSGSSGFVTYDGEVFGRSADNILYRVFGMGSSGNRFVEHDLALALKMISGTGDLDLPKLATIRNRLAPLATDDNPVLLEILTTISLFLERKIGP